MQSLISFTQDLLRTPTFDGVKLVIRNSRGKVIAHTGNENLQVQEFAGALQEEVAVSEQGVWQIIATENDEKHIASIRNVKVMLEIAIRSFMAAKANTRGIEEIVVEQLFAEREDSHKHDMALSGLFREHGYDTALPRAVILIELEEKTNRYFNINLDLGYDASAEKARVNLLQAVKENRYLNKQDIVAHYGFNRIIIIKAFMAISDTDKYYTALETIALDIMQGLETSKIFAPRLTYGKVCGSLLEIRDSYQEAQLLLRLGSQTLGRGGLYRAEDLLAELMVCSLPAAIVERRLRPLIRRLKAEGDEGCYELLRIVETYILAGYNITETAQKLYIHRNTAAGKIERYKAITGLNPGEHFEDTIMTKLLTVYLRLAEGMAI